MKALKGYYHLKSNVKKIGYHLLFGNAISFGKRTTFRNRFQLTVDQGGEIVIGDRCFFNHDCSLNAIDKIEIGSDCLFGEQVKVYDHNHRFADVTQLVREQGYSKAGIKIGSNCWIGSDVIILKGVTIGDHVVIGAGCIISQSIPSETLVRNQQTICQENILPIGAQDEHKPKD